MIADNEIRDANTLGICATLAARGLLSLARVEIFGPMALRDIFKFRDPPESETSKPFLEHLEDFRWTIVKMAITLLSRCSFVSRFARHLSTIMQRPLNDLGSQVGTLKAMGITDSITISFHLAFYAGIVLSFPLLLYFLAEFVLPALTAVEKRFLFPAIFVSFALFLLVCWSVITGFCRKRFFFSFTTRNRSAGRRRGRCSSIIPL